MIIKEFQKKVDEFPGNTAIKIADQRITYRQLNIYANQVADAIRENNKRGTKNINGQRVSLLFEQGAGMIVGMIGALKTNATYVPLDITYPGKRLLYMLKDSDSSLILTNNENFSLAQRLAKGSGREIGVINIDTMSDKYESANTEREEAGDNLAYILYTSGSTGQPKGVAQTHRNVLYYTRQWIERFSISGSDRMTLLSSFSHDGAVQDIFSALLTGACLYPYSLKTAPTTRGLYTLLMKEKITIWHSVPSLYRYFAGTLTIKDYFYHLRWVLLGGEPLRAHDLELLETYFPKAKLANVYGQTESSVTSICIVSPGENFDTVSLGEPLDETEILLVGEDGSLVGELEVGEVVVNCDYLAPGYWRDKESTPSVFTHDDELGRLYWTGDLGRLIEDGTIQMMGRKDFQTKIRGFRVETGEIENVLLRHQAIKEAITIAKVNKDDDNYLCAYYVSDETIPSAILREYLSVELPDYMIPQYFISLEKMPVTPNGKIDRNRLPNPEDITISEYEPPGNVTERKLVAIWQKILEIERVGVYDNFIELGGHSLMVISLISKIHQVFNVDLQLMDVFEHPTVKELARFIMASEEDIFSSIEPTENKEFYAPTPEQTRMHLLNQFEQIDTAYNIPGVESIEGKLDKNRFEEIFRELIRRHEAFRTSFQLNKGELVQVIHKYNEIDFRIDYSEVATGEQQDEEAVKKMIRDFIKPFDLSKAPLLRVNLVKLAENRHLLFMDMHHIVSDGISQHVLFNDFIRLYTGKELPELRLQYRDYSDWKNKLLHSEAIKKQEEFWLTTFNGVLPVLNMPTDYPRPPIQKFAGEEYLFMLSEALTAQLKKMVSQKNTTLFTILLAAYAILLSRFTGQEDIIVGLSVAGRNHTDLENIVGMCINTLPFRSFPVSDKGFGQFLEEVNETALSAFDNQDYPFETLLDKLKLPRDFSRTPLFDTLFNAITVNRDTGSRDDRMMRDLKVSPYIFENSTTKFDITFYAFNIGKNIVIDCAYRTSLFLRSTIEYVMGEYLRLLEEIAAEPDKLLKDYDIFSRRRLRVSKNRVKIKSVLDN